MNIGKTKGMVWILGGPGLSSSPFPFLETKGYREIYWSPHWQQAEFKMQHRGYRSTGRDRALSTSLKMVEEVEHRACRSPVKPLNNLQLVVETHFLLCDAAVRTYLSALCSVMQLVRRLLFTDFKGRKSLVRKRGMVQVVWSMLWHYILGINVRSVFQGWLLVFILR